MMMIAASASLASGTWQQLNTGWTVCDAGNASMCADAAVPGTVPDSLHAGGLFPDPQFGTHSNDAVELCTQRNFTYAVTFATPQRCVKEGVSCAVVFDGVDTASTVVLNGKALGRTENMHLRYGFNLGAELRPAGHSNQLQVKIESATQAAARTAAAWGDPGCNKANRGEYWPTKFKNGTICAAYIRKNTGSFGWDCARAYVAQGIWRPVWIKVWERVSIESIVPVISGAVAPDGRANNFTLLPRVNIDAETAVEAVFEAKGNWPGACGESNTSISLQPGLRTVDLPSLEATNVPLWWPNGLGQQPLFNLTVSVKVGGVAVAESIIQVGFRTFEFQGSVGDNTVFFDDASLYFKINGRPVFAKGHNWMPKSVLLSDSPELQAMVRARLRDAVAVHANTIRVWGGGVYESDDFYDQCDKLGLMVMQDGSFFSRTYPQVEEFRALVRKEVQYNAQRLARHPSLVLFSGNNEGSVYSDIKLYVDTELATMQQHNPNVAVYPSCPSMGWDTLSPLTPRSEDAKCKGGKLCPHDKHYYGPCGTIPSDPPTQFGSEFGWPSADILSVTDTITPKGEDKLKMPRGSSPFLDFRSTIKNPDWVVESMLGPNSTLTRTFPTLLGPGDSTREGMARWLYLTQALQAFCVTGSIAAYRQDPAVMGAVNWAINSIWVAPAWGSISHTGHWKVLHYRLRDTFAPLLLSWVTAGSGGCPSGVACLHASNHGDAPWTANGCVLKVRDVATSQVRHSKTLPHADVPGIHGGSQLVEAKLEDLLAAAGCGAVGECFVDAGCPGGPAAQPLFPEGLASARLTPAELTVDFALAAGGKVQVTVVSNTTTPFTFLSCELDGTFDDNAVVLYRAQPFVAIFTPSAEAVDVSALRDTLSIYTINNKLPWQASAR